MADPSEDETPAITRKTRCKVALSRQPRWRRRSGSFVIGAIDYRSSAISAAQGGEPSPRLWAGFALPSATRAGVAAELIELEIKSVTARSAVRSSADASP